MEVNQLSRLQAIPDLKDVPDDQLNWLIENSECLTIATGNTLFKPGDPISKLTIILEGKINVKIEQNGNFKHLSSLAPGTITGYLPYSRASNATGYAEAEQECQVMQLDKSKFKEMIHNHDELTTALVHVMSSRIREFTKLQQQNDKMLSLGKLSAGLAHELNNPSAAVVRSARSLKKHLSYLPEHFKSIIRIETDEKIIDEINKLIFSKVESGLVNLSMSRHAEREDEIAEWLEERGCADGYDLAENFVDFDFTNDDLSHVENQLRGEDLMPVLNWLNQVLTTEKLVAEIEDASQRINNLVGSVKSYTHMDQAPERHPVDIHNGLNSTVTMLKHKINKSGIKLNKEYGDLPEVCLFVSEINQVWTNLIDNAIDALEESDKKNLTIRTSKSNEYAQVEIIDSGSGIPDGIKDQIFDPFFTTKAIGKGTGLGLDVVSQIVNQHNGSITLQSKLGETIFKVCLPFN